MKRNTTVARVTGTVAGAQRIRNLEEKLGLAAINSRQHRTLSTAIRIEARTYRKALDTEQATAAHEARVQRGQDRSRAHPRRKNRSPCPVAGYAAAAAPTLGAEHKTMALSSWLFIREQESIWIERPYGFSVIVAGPGSARAHLVFPNEDALQAYQVGTAERLTRAGWFLWAFDQERRKRAERLATSPATPYGPQPAVEAGSS